MESHPEKEKLLVPALDTKPKKGGLRTVPFIILNESFERLASIGLTPNMVFYLMDNYHMEVTIISTIFSLWGTLSNGLSIFGAVIADSYLGRFWVIVLGSFSCLAGMIGVWSTALFPQLRGESWAQICFLLLCFLLISIGAGCIRPCSVTFGIDQLENKQNPDNKKLLQSFINWYSVSLSIAAVVALTVIVYIQDQSGWKVGFGIPAALMLFSAITILLGSSFYVHVEPSKCVFTGLVQALVAAFRKRRINLPPVIHDDMYYQDADTKHYVPTNSLRCLNRACVIKNPEEDLNPDGSASNPWKLCTVVQVESLKAVIRVLPIWSSGVMLMLTMYQNSFSTLQAKSMNRHIIGSFEFPAASVGVIMLVSIVLWLSFYDRAIVPILARYTKNSRGLSSEVRIAISLILSTVSMVISALVEARRRKFVIEKGIQDDPYAMIDMSAMWLLPQYVVMGVAEAISTTSQIEFFYLQLPKSMSSMGIALLTIEQAVASLVGAILLNVVNKVTSGAGKISWLDSNINKGHIDYYYWLIALISLANFFYFLVCIRAFPKHKHPHGGVYDDQEDEEEEEKGSCSRSTNTQ